MIGLIVHIRLITFTPSTGLLIVTNPDSQDKDADPQ